MLIVCVCFEPMLKFLGVQFRSALIAPGELIIFIVTRLSYVGFGVLMATIANGKIPVTIYLSGFCVFFCCLLLYSPPRLSYHDNLSLYFWVNWIGEFISRESRIYSAITVTLLILGYQIIPYSIAKLVIFLCHKH